MSGSSLDGLDIVFTELDDSGGTWKYEVRATACVGYNEYWLAKLQGAKLLSAFDYFALHAEYGRFIGNAINTFIRDHHLHHQVQLIASHGHTVFHAPSKGFTTQIGDGATIAAVTGINVVSGLRDMDVALGGQGAPIVPMGEKLLWKDYDYFLNIGGIANISHRHGDSFTAFDVCPANRVLNMLANLVNKPFDENGDMSASGTIDADLLDTLNNLRYCALPYPKSLANEFGTDVIYPLIKSHNLSVEDALRTYTEHIAEQVKNAVAVIAQNKPTAETGIPAKKMLVTGGGAFNNFLVNSLKQSLFALNIEVDIPSVEVVQYKEAIVMALLGILRWREENTVLSSVTGAKRNSIGGAVWMGQEA
jgi:anhydro-N-acetylmuramic acid kinase